VSLSYDAKMLLLGKERCDLCGGWFDLLDMTKERIGGSNEYFMHCLTCESDKYKYWKEEVDELR